MRRALLPILFGRNDGDYILKEKWDNLIILDACRYDTFEELYTAGGLKGRLEARISRGTETKQFLVENFGNSMKIRDLVYVTANPTVTQLFEDKFFKTVSVWRDAWSEKDHTVLPQDMYEHTLAAINQYPDKRLIIHFLQPHRPFIDRSFPKELWKKGQKNRFLHVWGSYSEEGKSLLAVASRETLMQLYRRNLMLVLPYVQKLLNVLPGVSIVTADHGEALGENIHPLIPIIVYGHPRGTRIRALTKVPWLVVESSQDKTIRAGDEPVTTDRLSRDEEELINQRLIALGYG